MKGKYNTSERRGMLVVIGILAIIVAITFCVRNCNVISDDHNQAYNDSIINLLHTQMENEKGASSFQKENRKKKKDKSKKSTHKKTKKSKRDINKIINLSLVGSFLLLIFLLTTFLFF